MSASDWREPQRRCLPIAEWPAADRAGWLAATSRGDLLLDDGPGAGLRAVTVKRHRKSYGRWLGCLERRGELDPESLPGERATPERVAGYIAELQALNASGTVLVRLQSLAVVLRWLAPEQDWSWLRPALAPALERYLGEWRPRLARPDRVARSRALWLTEQGRAISATHAHLHITRHTAAAFGIAVNPHGFRDAAATTIALACPERIGIVTPLLGHGSITAAQRHYNLAGMASAAEAWHEVLEKI